MEIHTRCKRKSKTITQIEENQFIIEGEIDKVKIGCTVYPIITFIDIDGGPFIHIGRDFFGKGSVIDIQNIDSDKDNYIIIKVTVAS